MRAGEWRTSRLSSGFRFDHNASAIRIGIRASSHRGAGPRSISGHLQVPPRRLRSETLLVLGEEST